MSHDFSDKHGGRGSSCNQNNHIMSYGNSKEKWSDCSVKDFKAWHLRMKDRWCMESKYMYLNPCSNRFYFEFVSTKTSYFHR